MFHTTCTPNHSNFGAVFECIAAPNKIIKTWVWQYECAYSEWWVDRAAWRLWLLGISGLLKLKCWLCGQGQCCDRSRERPGPCARAKPAQLFVGMHFGSNFGSGNTKGATSKRLGSCARAKRARKTGSAFLPRSVSRALALSNHASHKDKPQSPR